jgi:ketosteroid isomerase-like protein
MTSSDQFPSADGDAIADAERIYRTWDDALSRKDLDASLALYAEDATLESPLIRHLQQSNRGVLEGKAALRSFIEMVFRTQPPQRKCYRQGFFTDGTRLIWEYPRVTPDGEQFDLVEVMELKDGLIQHHRVYWGWFGLKQLQEGAHRVG